MKYTLLFLIIILSTLTGCRNSTLFYTPKKIQYNAVTPEQYDYNPEYAQKTNTQFNKYDIQNESIPSLRNDKAEFYTKDRIILKSY